MSRIICVLLSLSMVFTFAETDNLKETTKLSSEIKLPKEDGLLQNQIKTTNGEFEKISWEKAYKVFSEKLNKSIEEKGPDSTVWWASARVVTEANYLLQKFARTVVGTNNIDNCSRT